MKKIVLFLLAFFSLPLQAKGYRFYNADPTRSINLSGALSDENLVIFSKTLIITSKAFSQYLPSIPDASGLASTGIWGVKREGMFLTEKRFNLLIETYEDPVVIIEPIAGDANELKDPYVIEFDEWKKRFGAQPSGAAGQQEQKAEAAGVLPNFIPIKLPDGSLAQLDTSKEEELAFTSPFKDLIEGQFAKGDAYILARVVEGNGKAHYFDAHEFNFFFFKTVDLQAIAKKPTLTGLPQGEIRVVSEETYHEHADLGTYPIRFQNIEYIYDPVTKQYSYLKFFNVPENRARINPNIGVQYFVLRPNKVAEGFQYLCTYTAVRGFHNDVNSSPYKGQPQTFFLDYFYANQNGDSEQLEKLKTQSKSRIDPFERKLKEEAEAQERKVKEEAERKARESVAADNVIHLPNGETEKLDLSSSDPYTALSFNELIDEQKKKNDPFILARVVYTWTKKEGNKPAIQMNTPFYFDAHAFNQAFFVVGGTRFFDLPRALVGANGGLYFRNYKNPTNRQGINPNIGVQYFVYDPKAPQNGFQYFATYTDSREFHNRVHSPYREQPSTFYIDYFYANQNEAGLEKLKGDAKARLPELPKPAPAAPPAPHPSEQKAAAGDLASLSDDELEERARAARAQQNNVEEVRLLEELYRRMSLKNDEASARFKIRWAAFLGPLYLKGGNGLTPNYEKAKLYYTEMLNASSPHTKAEAYVGLQQITALLEAGRKSGASGAEQKTAQQRFEADLKAARDVYNAGDQGFNYLDAMAKLKRIYDDRSAPEAVRNEAAYYLGEIYFKGGRSVTPNNARAAEYLQTIMSGPFHDRAQDRLIQIAQAISLQSAAQPQHSLPGLEPEVKADAEAARRRAEAERRLREDADLATALAASMQPQQRPPSQAEQKAGRLPAQPVYPEEQKEREAKHREGQGVLVDVSDDLRLLHSSLLALHTAVR